MKRIKRFVIVSMFISTVMSACLVSAGQELAHKPTIKAVVFDLGGVLLGHSMLRYAQRIGIVMLCAYIMTGHNPKNMLHNILALLHRIKPLDARDPLSLAPDGSQPLPQLFREWLTGRQSNAELRREATAFIDDHDELFSGCIEQAFMKRAATVLFSPDLATEVIAPYAGALELVQWCKDCGLEVFILSNFDAESYDLLKEAYADLFSLFKEEHRFISGNMGVMKPDLTIFKTLIASSEFEADEFLFFDDQQENIEAARACGMHALQVTKAGCFLSAPDYTRVKNQVYACVQVQPVFV